MTFIRCVLFPQIIETYRDKSVDGLSPYFLLAWLCGDITSLIGAKLTGQLLFQILLAIYFLLNDGLGEEISESVRTICKHYQIDCIELKGLDKMSGHPSVKGMKQISEQVKAYMNSRHN